MGPLLLSPSHALGRRGEELAVKHLKRKGYRIICRGFRSGRGEIDIIAMDGCTLVFAEVKTRRDRRFGGPEEQVSRAKQSQIQKTALRFLLTKKVSFSGCRFDVIGIVFGEQAKPEISHFENAFP